MLCGWYISVRYLYYCIQLTLSLSPRYLVFSMSSQYLLILSEERDISLCNVHELKALCR